MAPKGVGTAVRATPADAWGAQVMAHTCGMKVANAVPDRGLLQGLMARVTGIVLDFDGPMCLLFPSGTAPQAEAIKQAVRADQGRIPLTMQGLRDSHAILQELRQDTSGAAGMVADLVTEAEFRAVRTAQPTEYLHPLVARLAGQGTGLAIASNNDAGAIEDFLRRNDLIAPFRNRVFGRVSHALQKMKPDPYCVALACDSMGLAPRECLMVGDKISDLEAAQAAGTYFLGCTDDASEYDQMEKLGADAVVTSLAPVLNAVHDL